MDVAELIGNSLFEGVDESEVAECAVAFEPIKRLGGERIMTEDEFGYSFYLLLSGAAEVQRLDGTAIATLNAGDYFGEVALVTGNKRNATVRATETCQLARAMTWDFAKLMEDHPRLAARIEAAAADRA